MMFVFCLTLEILTLNNRRSDCSSKEYWFENQTCRVLFAFLAWTVKESCHRSMTQGSGRKVSTEREIPWEDTVSNDSSSSTNKRAFSSWNPKVCTGLLSSHGLLLSSHGLSFLYFFFVSFERQMRLKLPSMNLVWNNVLIIRLRKVSTCFLSNKKVWNNLSRTKEPCTALRQTSLEISLVLCLLQMLLHLISVSFEK